MTKWIPEATLAQRNAHRAAHPELFELQATDQSAESTPEDLKVRELRYLAKGSLLTYAQDQGILDSISEEYQLEPAPDLERTARVAQSMGLVVDITFVQPEQ
jgi:hypothetical protein